MNEDTFLSSMLEDPASAAETWLVLADWLEEQGDARAELVRLCHDRHYRPDLEAGARDERVRVLLASGMKPCVPEWSNSVGMRFALIPAGKFLMGSPSNEEGRLKHEGPQREVRITRSLYMGIYPVTQQEYQRVMGTNPSWFSASGGGKDSVRGMDTRCFPVEQVSWKDAVEFCRCLSEIPTEKLCGHVCRLPTEAEWEYACRGGAASSERFHFGDALSPREANFDSTVGRPTPVGSYPPNAFGLFDMHGNIWEWCADWFGPYERKSVKDPPGISSGERRVVRGGSWCNLGRVCRTADRNHTDPGNRSNDLGFRVVCVKAPGNS